MGTSQFNENLNLASGKTISTGGVPLASSSTTASLQTAKQDLITIKNPTGSVPLMVGTNLYALNATSPLSIATDSTSGVYTLSADITNPSSLSVSGYSTFTNNVYLGGLKQLYVDNITSNLSTTGTHINDSNLVVHNDLSVLGNINIPKFSGTITGLSASNVGLGKVNNTSDNDKVTISTNPIYQALATQQATLTAENRQGHSPESAMSFSRIRGVIHGACLGVSLPTSCKHRPNKQGYRGLVPRP